MESFKHLNNQALVSEIETAVKEEREKTTRVLHLLREVELRKIPSLRGFDSLYSFATQFLGYTEGAAHRRISAMRALRDIPELESKILDGTLSLTNIAQAQVFFKQEAKQKKPLKLIEKQELLTKLENVSSRECQRILLAISPENIPTERRRELTEDKTEFRLVVDRKLKQKLDRLKSLWSHTNPSMSDLELLEKMADQCLKQVDPLERKPIKNQKEELPVHFTKTPAPGFINNSVITTRTRYIPQALKRQVWQRDQGLCQYQDPLTKRRCHSTHLIQIEHKTPWALAGEHTLQNLELLCATHNQLRAQQIFPGFKLENTKSESGSNSSRS